MDIAKTGDDQADKRNFIVTIVVLTVMTYLSTAILIGYVDRQKITKFIPHLVWPTTIRTLFEPFIHKFRADATSEDDQSNSVQSEQYNEVIGGRKGKIGEFLNKARRRIQPGIRKEYAQEKKEKGKERELPDQVVV